MGGWEFAFLTGRALGEAGSRWVLPIFSLQPKGDSGSGVSAWRTKRIIPLVFSLLSLSQAA